MNNIESGVITYQWYQSAVITPGCCNYLQLSEPVACAEIPPVLLHAIRFLGITLAYPNLPLSAWQSTFFQPNVSFLLNGSPLAKIPSFGISLPMSGLPIDYSLTFLAMPLLRLCVWMKCVSNPTSLLIHSYCNCGDTLNLSGSGMAESCFGVSWRPLWRLFSSLFETALISLVAWTNSWWVY